MEPIIESRKMTTIEKEKTNMTITLTQEQKDAIEQLRMTTMSGEEKTEGNKSFEEMVWSVIERGISSHLQTRKQYQRTRMAVKMYSQK